MKKINRNPWGSILVDITVIICATWSSNYWLLLILLISGSYSYTQKQKRTRKVLNDE